MLFCNDCTQSLARSSMPQHKVSAQAALTKCCSCLQAMSILNSFIQVRVDELRPSSHAQSKHDPHLITWVHMGTYVQANCDHA